ncbi:Uncharacterized membrane protein YgaE, UPF0421/DUF939 family [Peptoniphilus asaccharolyticus DSM 20463]|uniref:Uncharacterized membrane protein YgaE, UPF0421/DUF939 family n=1 Tax=Peptoniphilus asaccharolyticus DSM 20463 TaxID=573058 RepID=A0A1W1V438_PEPAS|nr:aromatic acid exporter family protein [Peptoniphilus asaccharolyticus]MBL7576304.1 aromatic acid exporter family protein [Peptoniphilus asaccharolyticus]SMB88167.1 Uncharacterized membrane protein YgaE, UPF0421/DUF939 family [Peptoniphilus asaccharolyticus DSM 20463]
MRITGLKTIKIAFAAGLSLLVAEFLGLKYPTAAAIIAILSVMDTKKATLKGIGKRMSSAVLALLIGSICFIIFGYNFLAYVVYLVLFVPISIRLKIDIGLGPSSVLVTHLLLSNAIDSGLLINEIILVVIGSGFALISNWYFPSASKELQSVLNKIDKRIRAILVHYSNYITKDMPLMKGEVVFSILDRDLKLAEKLLKSERENMFYEESSDLTIYLTMRTEQIRILRRMFENLKYMPPEFTQGKGLAELMVLEDGINSEVELTDNIVNRLEELYIFYKNLPLPETRDEFEMRSTLFRTYLEFKEFVDVRNAYDNVMKAKELSAN